MADQAAIDKIMESLHWLGHDAFRLDRPAGPIYWDPYQLSDSAAGPASLILISHDHFDHCSPDDVAKIQGPETVIVTEPNAADKLSGNVVAMQPFQGATIGDVRIEAVPSYNLDKNFHPRGNDWLGFIITVDGVRIYHAGDADYIPEMDSIRCDIAMLPVSGTYVMTAAEAVEAALVIGPKLAIPMHYGAVAGGPDDAAHFAQALEGQVAVKVMDKEA